MKKLLLLFVLISLNNSFSQLSQNLNVSFGVLSPLSGINGYTVSVGFEKQLSSSQSIYFYGGNIYSAPEKLYYGYNQNESTFYSDDNNIYSFYCGTRFLLSTIKTFRIYTDIELGYNYMTYNSYDLIEYEDAMTHQKVYYPDMTCRVKIHENLLGIGFGIGVSHQLTDKAGFILEIKRNQMFKQIDKSLTRFSLNCGLFYNI